MMKNVNNDCCTGSIRLSVLSLAIHDKFDKLSLIFRAKDSANNIFSVKFSFIELCSFNNKCMVLKGILGVKCSNQITNGTIEYNFSNNKFYRVRCYANGTVRRIHELEINPVWNDMKIVNGFLSFISNCLYSNE